MPGLAAASTATTTTTTTTTTSSTRPPTKRGSEPVSGSSRGGGGGGGSTLAGAGQQARPSSAQSHLVAKPPYYNLPTYLPPSPPKSRSPSPSPPIVVAASALGADSAVAPSPLLSSENSTARLRTSTGLAQHSYQTAGPAQHWNDLPSSMMATASGRKGSLPMQATTSSSSSSAQGIDGAGASARSRSPHTMNGYLPQHTHANTYAQQQLPNGYHPNYGYQAQSSPHLESSSSPKIHVGNLYNRANEAISNTAHAVVQKTTTFNLPNSPLLPSSASSTATSATSNTHSSHYQHGRRKSIAQHVVPSISTVRFVAYCTLWYTSSAVSNNTGKSILNRFKYPVTLTFVQFGFVAGWCIIFCIGRTKIAQMQQSGVPGFGGGSAAAKRHHHHARSASLVQTLREGGWGIKKPTRTALQGVAVMSLFQIAGHIFSSMATARIPVSTVHTIKALSPLFTVMSYGLMFGVRYSHNTYLSLLPLTIGVMLACSFDLRANAAGLVCALGSTVIFVSQNIFSKKLLPKDGSSSDGTNELGEKKLDKLHLLLYSSGMAFLGMIPIWFYYDAFTVLLSSTASSHRSCSLTTLWFYFAVNGSVHFLQNLLAFSILSLTSPVTYSIASLIKRIAVICMAIVWFGQTVYPLQAVGISMTAFGLYMYNQAKKDVERGEKKRVKVERRNSLLLPSSSKDDGLLGNGSDSDTNSTATNGMAGVGGRGKGWGIVR